MDLAASRVRPGADAVLETLIIGAGPSGLTAADHLAAAGRRPLVVERSQYLGGLMRSFRHGPFTVDLGRKELYARIPEIDLLWNTLLGACLRPYPHRVGSLFAGRILELSGHHRGPSRGMPPALLLTGGVDLLRGWLDGALHRPNSYERFWYQRAGRRFARALAQGYWEKFRGQRWSELPVPDELADGESARSHSFTAITQGLRLAARGSVSGQMHWRHPALGTGQLTQKLAARIRRNGGEIRMNTEVVELAPADGDTMLATLRHDGQTVRCRADAVISSMSPDTTNALLHRRDDTAPARGGRTVVLVYLFFDTPPRFPHAWLEVNDQRVQAGRITNYAAFGGEMVPAGKAALCVEYFLDGHDPRLAYSDEDWTRLAMSECAANLLADRRDRLFDTTVLRMERCNAAASWRDAQDHRHSTLYQRLRRYPTLYHVNRPGTDWASFAGLCAANAVLTGDRQDFDKRADPTRSYAASNTIGDRT